MSDQFRMFYTGQSQKPQKDNRVLQPFFILFLDSVNQIMKMNPFDFEINSEYLAHLAYHVYTNKFFEFI